MLSASAALILFCWNKVQCPHLAQPVPLLLVYTSSSYPVDSLWMCVCVRVRACVCVLMEVYFDSVLFSAL